MNAQFGPVPPRLNIPGAISLGPVPQRERFLQPEQPQQQIRVRRPLRPAPNQPAIHQPRFVEPIDARPVIEEPEESGEFIPQHNFHAQAPSPAPTTPSPPPQPQYQQQEQSNAARFNVERPKPQFRQLQQPQHRPQQHFQHEEEFDEIPSRPVHRAQPKPQPHHSPAQPHHHNEKPKKPVAQILRKWRDEHEDGSITWGYENDGEFLNFSQGSIHK